MDRERVENKQNTRGATILLYYMQIIVLDYFSHMKEVALTI